MKALAESRPRRRKERPAPLANGGPVPTERVLDLVSRFDPTKRYFLVVPSGGGAGAPVFVSVHGLSRNAREHASLFAPYCERLGAVLVAPLFTAEHARDYQRLGREGHGARADIALENILEEVSLSTGASTAPFHLFGFSGGAQFAHRFAMAFPRRVASVVIASAGWYTFPDRAKRYPYGIRAIRDLPDVRFDPEEFLQVPITVLVGEQDTSDVDLRKTKRVNRQGLNRVERGQNWVRAMQKAAHVHRLEPRVSFETIPDGDHSFTNLMQARGLGDRVFASLFAAPVPLSAGGSRG